MIRADRDADLHVDAGDGPERRCVRCGEYWPADTEFFYRRGDGLHSWCKACCTERTGELREGAPRLVARRRNAGGLLW